MTNGGLEEALADWIGRVGAAAGNTSRLGRSLVRDLRAALFTSVLDAKERAIAELWRSRRDEALIDDFLQSRIRRVLSQALARVSAPQAPFPVPEVIVRRGGLPRPVPEMAENEDLSRILVLADGPAFGVLSAQRLVREGDGGAGAGAAAFLPGINLIEVVGSFERVLKPWREACTRHRSLETLSDLSAKDPESLVGCALGTKYLLTQCLGVGGFGAVYEARDLLLDASVAIKVLNHWRSQDRKEQIGFKEEARRVTRLRHPNIVEWKAFDEAEDGTCYFVMELVDGVDLRSAIDAGEAFSEQRTIRLLKQMLAALRCAHEREDGEPILHLDLKPQNMLLAPGAAQDGGESLKIIDFGIACAGQPNEEPEARSAAPLQATTVRSIDRVESSQVARVSACTPEYAAPELCAHLLEGPAPPLDARADVYSVGVLGFEMLTGRLPIAAPEDRMLLLEHKQEVDIPPTAELAPDLPRALARFLDLCLARDPGRRWGSAAAALAGLERIERRRRRFRLASVASLLLVLSTAGVLKFVPAPSPPSLTPLRVEAGVARPIFEDRLYFGPRNASVVLRVDGLTADERPARVSLVAEPVRGSPELAGESPRLVDDGTIVLSLDGGDEREADIRYLRFDMRDGGMRYSKPLELVWLGSRAVTMESIVLPHSEKRALDPLGRSATLVLRAVPDDVDIVELSTGEWIGSGSRISEELGDGQVRYRVPLDGLRASGGKVLLSAAARNRAGGEDVLEREVAVTSEALRIASATLDCLKVGDSFFIPSDGPVLLDLRLNGRADVNWALRTSADEVALGGSFGAPWAAPLDLGTLAGALGGRSYTGRIELFVDDVRQVDREDPERGRDAVSIPIEFVSGAPKVRLQLRVPGGAPIELASRASPIHLSCEEFDVRVLRESEHALVLGATLERLAGERKVEQPLRRMVDPLWTEETFHFGGVEEGRYRLSVRAWQGRSATGKAGGAPDLALDVGVVIDCQAPTLLLDGVAEELVVRNGTVCAIVRARDPRAGEPSAPVHLTWRQRMAGRAGMWIDEGEAESVAGRVSLQLPARPSEPDGRYELVVQASDPAGNTSDPLTIPYSVSRNGPEVLLLEPGPAGDWRLSFDCALMLRASAIDPNGVAAVRACLRLPGAEQRVRADLEPVGEHWEGRLFPSHAWAGRAVVLEMTAVDRCGSQTHSVSTVMLSEIDEILPPLIEVAIGAAPVTRMRLVRGNAAAPYVFGGRSDEVENEAFLEAGLPPFDSLSLERSWAMAYREGALDDFYLDEHEVTVEQLAAFVADADAWHRGDLWPGPPPDENRRVDLLRQLAKHDGRRPVTSVSWDEARAYASFVGKRLPSVVEWEFAVRGGARYRPASTEGPPTHTTSSSIGLFAADTGNDVTPDTRIRNLTSNASEWTGSPYLSQPEVVLSTAADGESDQKRAFLRPEALLNRARRDEFWAVGVCSGSSPPNFASIDAFPRTFRSPSLGFRCAISVDCALRSVRNRTSAGPRFGVPVR